MDFPQSIHSIARTLSIFSPDPYLTPLRKNRGNASRAIYWQGCSPKGSDSKENRPKTLTTGLHKVKN